MGKGPVYVGGSRVCVRHSSEHGLGLDGAEGEVLKLGDPRSSSISAPLCPFTMSRRALYANCSFCPASS